MRKGPQPYVGMVPPEWLIRPCTYLKTALRAIWNDPFDETIRKSVLSFRKSLTSCSN